MMWLLHIIALFIFPLALFITIPLHLLIGGKSVEEQKKKNKVLARSLKMQKARIKREKEDREKAKLEAERLKNEL